jgi:hypothetical protein
VVGNVDTGLEEGLKIRYKRAPKTFQDKKWDAITACCFEGMRLFDNTCDLVLRNLHRGRHFSWVGSIRDICEVSIWHGGEKPGLQGFSLLRWSRSNARGDDKVGDGREG